MNQKWHKELTIHVSTGILIIVQLEYNKLKLTRQAQQLCQPLLIYPLAVPSSLFFPFLFLISSYLKPSSLLPPFPLSLRSKEQGNDTLLSPHCSFCHFHFILFYYLSLKIALSFSISLILFSDPLDCSFF